MNDVEKDPPLNGLEILRQSLANLGQEAGVYRMIDAKESVLYVGKAKHLKNRVSNYVNIDQLPTRLQRMVMLTAKLETIITRSEAEALLVEANLIKQYKPRYNILLKDDKSYPYIHFSGNHAYPRISKYRGAQTEGGVYFGPFVSAGAVDEMLKILQKAFRLRPCSDNIFKHRTRPCLQYQIKRCSAPCVGYISEADYAKDMSDAKRFLKGESEHIRAQLTSQMQQSSEAMQFERAAELRDRLKALTHIQQQQNLSLATLKSADFLVLVREQGAVCVQLFAYRYGSNFGNHSFFPANIEEVSDADILEAFIGRYYQRHPPPEQLVLSHELPDAEVVAEALKLCSGHKVELFIPKRGEKMEALNLALANTRDTLKRHLAAVAVQSDLLEQMATLFELDAPPERIEIYDNSHISGAQAIGAMVVATPDGFDKKSYRTYTMKAADLRPGDDYAMLREMLTRRLKRLTTDDEQLAKPDLLLIDGGAGQLSVAVQVCESLGISDIKLVAIAKGVDRNAGREWFHLPDKVPFQLPEHHPLLHYLERLRDEAHRFAIGTHRNKRSKSLVQSELDNLQGIGPKRKRALLLHFGSVRAISAASIEDIAKVEGINTKVAEQIYQYFH
jgi:excinuclease ABC subunit C